MSCEYNAPPLSGHTSQNIPQVAASGRIHTSGWLILRNKSNFLSQYNAIRYYYMYNVMYIYIYDYYILHIHVLRDEKEGRSKQGQTNNRAKQHSTCTPLPVVPTKNSIGGSPIKAIAVLSFLLFPPLLYGVESVKIFTSQ